ncbi:hypothetical protein D7V82_14210 [bacterium 1xD8-6]|nr:hypothetical protein D7V72_15810 [bacterium D16-36]RKI66788.1 hypothetical protein D7V82_14210 [bacterium 1xD8-6]
MFNWDMKYSISNKEKWENNLVMQSENCHKRKNMIKYWRGTIVLQGGSLPKLHARFAGVHKRGGGANDSF